MLFVTWIDTFGTVAGKEIFVELKTRLAFQYRYANLFGATRVYGRFIDDDVAFLQYTRNDLARAYQRSEIRSLVVIDRRGHRDDVRRTILEVLGLRCELQMIRGAEVILVYLLAYCLGRLAAR